MSRVALNGLSESELAAAATANLVTHFSWVQRRTPGMHVIESDDIVLIDSGLPCDTYNAVCRAKLDSENAPARIQSVINHFATVRRPFSWWLNPGDEPAHLNLLLRDAGLEHAESELAMAANLTTTPFESTLPEGLRIERVRTFDQLQDFARIVAANWVPPDRQVVRFYELAAPVVLAEDCPLWFYVGYLEDTPVVSSELTVGGGVVGLYNICTLEAYRRRGFGAALTTRPLVDAQEQGHQTAILQASDQGARVYARIGFEPFGQITEYKPVNG